MAYDYEISFNGPGVAVRTLNANRFVKIFAEKLHAFFTNSSLNLICYIQAYRGISREYLVVKWRDAHDRAFDYTFRCTGYGAFDYNIDGKGCFRIESGDTMTAGDMSEALAYVDHINQLIGELRHGEGEITMKLVPSAFSGGEECLPS